MFAAWLARRRRSHSMSRYMLFWWPPILLSASQSKRPRSESLTPLMVNTDRPWRPRTSNRPSWLWEDTHMHTTNINKTFFFIPICSFYAPLHQLSIYFVYPCIFNANFFMHSGVFLASCSCHREIQATLRTYKHTCAQFRVPKLSHKLGPKL